jgi:hypothetical protein
VFNDVADVAAFPTSHIDAAILGGAGKDRSTAGAEKVVKNLSHFKVI